MATYTPSGLQLRNHAPYTPSSYPLDFSDESDDDFIPTPNDDWSTFKKLQREVGEIESSKPEEFERKAAFEKALIILVG